MLMNFSNALYTSHMGKWASRSPSPRIWSRMPVQGQNPDGSGAVYGFADDFIGFGVGTAKAANIAYYNSDGGAYKSREDTSSTILPNETDFGGVLQFTTAATDNDELYLQHGMSVATSSAPFYVTSGAIKPLFYETALKIGAASFDCGVIAGLASKGLAAADTLVDDTMVLATAASFIGFKIDATSTLRFEWKAASQTAQSIVLGNIQSSTGVFTGTTLTTALWNNLGFRINPLATPAKRLKIYVNNVEQSTYVTDTNIAAATFPSAVQLAAILGIKNGTAAARTVDVDFHACYQGR